MPVAELTQAQIDAGVFEQAAAQMDPANLDPATATTLGLQSMLMGQGEQFQQYKSVVRGEDTEVGDGQTGAVFETRVDVAGLVASPEFSEMIVALAEAGAFAMVVEGVVEPLAQRITQAVPVPTIGIGASAACDGQILVGEDAFGLFAEFTPKFVKRYADLAGTIAAAAKSYAEDVRARRFPGPEHVYRHSASAAPAEGDAP